MRIMLLAMLLLAASACERQATEAPAPAPLPEDIVSSSGGASKLPKLVPMPADRAERDRLILAGYTPHSDHLHAPGVNECPMNKGTDVVM